VECANCRAKIGVSWLSSFSLLALGTWLPVAGAVIGAGAAAGISDGILIGGAMGLVVSAALFAAIYFRSAKLIVV
jgi:hypothetical protein